MRGRVAHFPEVVEHGSQAAPEVVIPDAVDGHARGERVVAGQDPFGERQTASRCPAVGGRKFHRRIAHGGHGKKPRLHQRSVAVDVAVDQEIRGRGLIAARTGMDVRALNPGLRNAFARSRLVARAVGGEAVIAVGDPHGHRDGRGALFFNRFDGFQQILADGRVLRPDDAVYLRGGYRDGEEHLAGQQLLSRRALIFGGRDGILHVLREPPVLGREQGFAIGLFQDAHLFAKPGDALVDGGNLPPISFGFGGRDQRVIHLDVRPEDGLQAVIIFLGDGIELVVVAARALDGEAQNSASDGGDHVVQILVAEFGIVFFAEAHLGVIAQEAGGDQAVVGHLRQFVSRQLFAEESVVRLVLIERADDVIAIAPGVGAVEIMFEAVGVGIAGNVEPVTSPALAVLGRTEQAVDQPLPCARLLIIYIGCRFGGRGKEAGKIEIGAAKQGGGVGLGGFREMLFAPGLFEEGVDGVAGGGRGEPDRLAESPVIARAGRQDHVFQGCQRCQVAAIRGFRIRGRRFFPRRALIDPRLDQRGLFVGEFPIHRHGGFFKAGHAAVKGAGFGLAGDQSGAALSAGEGVSAGAQIEFA